MLSAGVLLVIQYGDLACGAILQPDHIALDVDGMLINLEHAWVPRVKHRSAASFKSGCRERTAGRSAFISRQASAVLGGQ